MVMDRQDRSIGGHALLGAHIGFTPCSRATRLGFVAFVETVVLPLEIEIVLRKDMRAHALDERPGSFIDIGNEASDLRQGRGAAFYSNEAAGLPGRTVAGDLLI